MLQLLTAIIFHRNMYSFTKIPDAKQRYTYNICLLLGNYVIRDRPFNLQGRGGGGGGGGYVGFLSFRIFFSDTRVRILFFCRYRANREFFFQNLTLGCMTKNSESDFFFRPPKSEYFVINIGNQNIFFRKNHSLPAS